MTGGEIARAGMYLRGIWNFQKDSMYTSGPNAFSNGFSKNQIKIIKTIFRQEIQNYNCQNSKQTLNIELEPGLPSTREMENRDRFEVE